MAWSEALVADLAGRIAALPAGLRIVGVDSHGGAGKSTLADALAGITGAVVVRTDDFYLPRAERLERFLRSPEPSSAFDVARVEAQVVRPLLSGAEARWQRYDWPSDELREWHRIEPGGTVIVEGVTALHPTLRRAYGVSVWVAASRRTRFERMLARGHGWPEVQLLFWIAEEDRYVERFRPDAAAHVHLNGDAGAPQGDAESRS